MIMRKRFNLLLLSVTILFLSACANTHLAIKVDLYDEDPRLELPMSPAKARDLISNLQTLRAESRKDTQLKIMLASESVEIYSSAWAILSEVDTNVRALTTKLDNYQATLIDNDKIYSDQVNLAITGLRDYVKNYQIKYEGELRRINDLTSECNQPSSIKNVFFTNIYGKPKTADSGEECILRSIRNELRDAETKAMDATQDAIASYKTPGLASTTFSIDWPGLEYQFNYEIQKAHLSDNDGRIQILKKLSQSVAQRLRAITHQLDENGRSLSHNITRSPFTSSTLLSSSLAVANELETLRNDLPDSATSRTALGNLVTGTSRFIELIDRLQDPGDPVWRVVTDPSNEGHWNEKISEVYFYAEGDAGVVVVRDDPLRYRVQSAKNNPAALIKGQLQIERAISNAAISIAGAASGIPTVALASSKPGSETDNEINYTASGIAQNQAQADAWLKQRETSLLSLERYLRIAAEDIDELDSKDKKFEEQKSRQIQRVKAILEGHKPLLKVTSEVQ